jgi:hypothetical protein
LELVV